MAWYNENGNSESVVLSTRVRFARNLEDYPFTGTLTAAGAAEINEKVKAALRGYRETDFSSLSRAEAASFVEQHYVSPEFVDRRLPRILLSGEGDAVQVMVCEEDHVRIQSIVSGFDPEKAFALACKADDAICGELKIAFDEKLGFLTQCPTNLGNAMRVSAMIFLPALGELGRIGALSPMLNKLGMTVRGMYGEGSGAAGNVYQISNSVSLGVSEEDILKRFTEVVKKVVSMEEGARQVLIERDADKLTDRVSRSLGILKSAYMLSSEELSQRISDVRLGKALGLIDTVDYSKLTELTVASQPATMMRIRQGMESQHARDKARAKMIRDALTRKENNEKDGHKNGS